MKMNSNLKTRIMRRVYAIWMLRKATSPMAVKFLILAASVWQFKERVFVAKVFENMPSLADPNAAYGFFTSALTHAQFAVQASILVGAVFGLLLVQDLFRKQQSYWF